jgi:hypothetical protein
MEFKNIKQGKTKQVEVYYERLQKLVHGLQTPTTNNFLSKIIVLYKDYNYRNEMDHVTGA